MNFIIKLFPEITIKSGPVRKRMSRQLTENMRFLLKRYDASAKVRQDWDKIEVSVDGEEKAIAIADILSRIPGIANFSRVRVFPLGDLQDIYERTQEIWSEALAGKTFVVRVKRHGDHEFTSTEVERYVGGGLNQHTEALGVSLRTPDVKVRLEIKQETLYVVEQSFQGLGGFPVGVQENVLSLISGGFDSTVASYQSIRRGLRTHFLFFNIGGKAHEIGVKEIAFYLWNRYGSSHRVKFISVPFDGVVNEILSKVDPSCMGVILKRMMFRAASVVADRSKADAFVTGEAVAQVSSQTLTNLSVIDRVTEKLVIRPLALMDKGEIIDRCRAIGAEEFSANIPEYCGVISVRPSAHLKLHKVESQEALMDMQVLDDALEQAVVQSIDAVMADVEEGVEEVEPVDAPLSGQVVIDIRHPNERELRPLRVVWSEESLDEQKNAVVEIPFYSLSSQFDQLDSAVTYLLYCDKGVMSQLHAVHLRDEGYDNVGVYRPS